MEANWRWVLVTAIAPVAWGATYYVTQHYLPAEQPLWGAVIRALPAGLLLLTLGRRLPRGVWWHRSLILGTLNVGAFFALVYVAAQLLPTSIASTVMAMAPIAMMLFAWALLSERPTALPLIGAALGIAGVVLLLAGGASAPDPLGLIASISAMAMSSLGYVLTTRWGRGADLLPTTAWQLVAGGLVLLPVAVVVEGAPPALDTPAIVAFGFVSFIATGVAYLAWFAGLRRLGAGRVGLIGLLNPVTGVLLGTLIAGELLAGRQVIGLLLVLAGILTTLLAPRRRAELRLDALRKPHEEHLGATQSAEAPNSSPRR